jgi:hypothetical protein
MNLGDLLSILNFTSSDIDMDTLVRELTKIGPFPLRISVQLRNLKGTRAVRSRNGTDWRTNTDYVRGGDTELHLAGSRLLGIIAWMQSSLACFEAGTNAAQPPLLETLEEQQRAAKCKSKI